MWSCRCIYGCFQAKHRGTQNGWFIVEKSINMDDLGVPLFLETPIFNHTKRDSQFCCGKSNTVQDMLNHLICLVHCMHVHSSNMLA